MPLLNTKSGVDWDRERQQLSNKIFFVIVYLCGEFVLILIAIIMETPIFAIIAINN